MGDRRRRRSARRSDTLGGRRSYPADAPEASSRDARGALEIATAVLASVEADFEQSATEENDEHVVDDSIAQAAADDIDGIVSTSDHEADD